MINILMIEDDSEFAELLSEYLEKYNIRITNYEDPYLGMSAGVDRFDLLILDLTLPSLDGLEVCKEIVKNYDIPIIISSARGDVSDKIIGLQLGADDYLPKPYDPKEMYARIISLLRRYKKINKDKEPKSDFRIDEKREIVYFKEKPMDLTLAEYEVLKTLVKNQGFSVSREQIINSSLSLSDTYSKSLDVIISRLRSKLNDSSKSPKYIRSIRGIGYKLL